MKPNMSSAKLYLQANVVDRLSRPVTSIDGASTSRAQDDSMLRTFDNSFVAGEQGNVVDAATFLGALQVNAASSTRPVSPHPTASAAANNTQASASKPPMSKEEIKQRQEKFAHFYARQQMLLERKQKSLENVSLFVEFSYWNAPHHLE